MDINQLKEIGALRGQANSLISDFRLKKEALITSKIEELFSEFNSFFSKNGFEVKDAPAEKTKIATFGGINITIKLTRDGEKPPKILIDNDADKEKREILIDCESPDTSSVKTNGSHELDKLRDSINAYKLMLAHLEVNKLYYVIVNNKERRKSAQAYEAHDLLTTLYPQ